MPKLKEEEGEKEEENSIYMYIRALVK